MNNEPEQVYIINIPNRPPATTTTHNMHESTTTEIIVSSESKMCRICATMTEMVMPIFEAEGVQNNLADKIHKYLPIQVSQQDLFPRVVCYQCVSTLLAFHELVLCCEQVDIALRTRQLPSEVTNQASNSNAPEASSVTDKEDIKFVAIRLVEIDARPEPPEYPNADASPTKPPQYPDSGQGSARVETDSTRICEYCHQIQDERCYTEHLNAAHSKLFFHCDECDTNVDKKDFLFHMSLHAFEYAKVQNNNTDDADKKQNSNENCNFEINAPTKEERLSNSDELLQNEFSDNSDAEQGFETVPNSIFEAIEDSSHDESQPSRYIKIVEDNQDLDGSGKVEPGTVEESQDSQSNKPTDNAQKDDDYKPNDSDSDTSSDECNEPRPVKTKKKNTVRTCKICAKSYTAASSYFYHMRYHHGGVKEHECDVCGRKFGMKACLSEHFTIHTGEQKRECKECGKTFRSKASLYIHEQVHTGIKTWECSQCYKTFRWRTHLLRHLKRHSKEKGYVCPVCDRGFSVKSDLNRHVRTHNVGSYPCEICGNKFAQVRYLKVHMLKIHGEIYNQTVDTSKTSKEPTAVG